MAFVLLLSSRGAAIKDLPEPHPVCFRLAETDVNQRRPRVRDFLKVDQYTYIEQEKEAGIQRT